MQKIFVVTTNRDIHGIGGVESYVYAMIEYFRKSDEFSLSVVDLVTKYNPTNTAQFRQWDIDLHEIIDPGRPVLSEKKLLDVITDDSIVFFNSASWYPVFKEIKRLKSGCRIIIRSGGNDVWMPWRSRESFFEKTARYLACSLSSQSCANYIIQQKVAAINHNADTLITNSNYSTSQSLEAGVQQDKIVQITGCVAVRERQIKSHSEEEKLGLKVIFVGRIEKFKGLNYAISAFSYASGRSSIPMQMIIVGDGRERRIIENKTKQLGLLNITFVGKVPFPEVLKFYDLADVFLHMPIHYFRRSHSFCHTETMGRSLLEANAAALPIVTTDIGGVSNVVTDGVNGFLVEEEDFRAAGEKLLLLQDSILREKMGEAGRSMVEEKYSLDKYFSKLQTLLTIQ